MENPKFAMLETKGVCVLHMSLLSGNVQGELDLTGRFHHRLLDQIYVNVD